MCVISGCGNIVRNGKNLWVDNVHANASRYLFFRGLQLSFSGNLDGQILNISED